MLRAALTVTCLTLSFPSWAIYKCEADGKVTYSESPCQAGRETRLANQDTPPEEQDKARDRAEQQKREADRLTEARREREAQEERLSKGYQRGSASAERRCRTLAIRKERAAADTRDWTRLDIESVRQRAQRAAQNYETECGR